MNNKKYAEFINKELTELNKNYLSSADGIISNVNTGAYNISREEYENLEPADQKRIADADWDRSFAYDEDRDNNL